MCREVAQMIAPNQTRAKKERAAARRSSRAPDLPFRIELWDEEKRAVERVVARAHSENLAQAIFKAACAEFPDRYLSLWRGRERLADKSDKAD
jgi:hypothetical protein